MNFINEDYQDEYSTYKRRSQKNKNLYQSMDNILWNNITQSSKSRSKTPEFDVSRLDRIIKDYEEYKQNISTRTQKRIQNEITKYETNSLDNIEHDIDKLSSIDSRTSTKYSNSYNNHNYDLHDENNNDLHKKSGKVKELFITKSHYKRHALNKKEFSELNDNKVDLARRFNKKIKIASGIVFIINTITIVLLIITLANK